MKIESKKIMAMFLAATITAGGAYTGFIDTEKIGIDNTVVEAHAETKHVVIDDRSYDYKVKSDNTIEITEGSLLGNASLNIPSTIDGYEVTSIGYRAYYDNKWIEHLSIPSSVKVIGKQAFYRCSNMKTLKLEEGLETIGDGAFGLARGLTYINIPSSVKIIEDFAFSGRWNGKTSYPLTLDILNEKGKISSSPERWDGSAMSGGLPNLTVNWLGVPKVDAKVPTITTHPQGGSYVEGDKAKILIVSASSQDGGTLSYQWYKDDNLISGATYSTYTPETLVPSVNKYYCVVTNTNNSATGNKTATVKSNVVNVTVTPKVDAKPPVITLQPTSNNYVEGETPIPLVIEATSKDSGTITYQWYKDKNILSGETSNTYTPNTNITGVNEYYCVVKNTNNSATGKKIASLESFPIMINVISKVDAEAPIITQQPISSTYTIGDKANPLFANASVSDGGTLSYQWFKGDSSRIDGATSSNFTPSTTGVGTENYYCEITNTNNSVTGNKISTTKSNIATINVIEADPYLKPLTKLDLTYDEEVPPPMVPNPIIVNGDGYTVKKLLYNADTDTKLSEYEMTIMPYTDVGSTNRYYLKVLLTKGEKRVELNTDVFTLTRRETLFPQTPVIDKDISSKTINQDDDLTLEVNASVTDGGNLTYQWFKDNNKIFGETSNVLAVKNISNSKESSFYCEITNTIDYSKKVAGGKIKSKSVNSNTATITVKEKTPHPPVEVNPVAPVITKNLSEDEATYTLGDSSNELEVEATVSDSGTLSYQWFANDVELPGEISNKYTPSTTEIGTSKFYCQVTNTLDGKTAMVKSNTAIITVEKVDNGNDNKPQEPLVNAKVPVITKDLDKTHIDTTVNKGSIDLDIEAKSQDDGVLSYQWLKDGNIIDNETKESLTIDTSQTGTHLYKCLVTNTLDIATGDKTATISSKTVSITVEPKVSEPSNNRKPSRPSKPIDENTTEEKTTDEPVDEIIEIILPNPDSDTTEVPGTEKDYIYGKDKDGNIFEVEHYYDRNKKVHIIKILSDYFIIKSSVPLETTTENPMLYKEVINTGAIDTTNNFSFCSKFVNHFCLDGIKKSIKFYLTK